MTRPPLPAGPYLVAGIGRAGLAAARRLVSLGAGPVSAWDEHAPSEGPAPRALAELGVALLPADVERALTEANPRCVIKSPGIALDHPLFARARAGGAAVIDEFELGWRTHTAPLAGVTGTDGKSTVTHLIGRALHAIGTPIAMGGNFELRPPLSALDDPAGGWVVCEVSSYQLEGCPDVLAEVGVLTNLSHDHLARHDTMARYGACKRRLFVRGGRASSLAVMNADDPFARRVGEEVAARGGEVRWFGREAGDYRVRDVEWDLDGARVVIDAAGDAVAFRTRLPGPHNAANVAAALAAAEGMGVARQAAVAAIQAAPGVPGRFERIATGRAFDAIVDFAHTPAAVATVLGTARAVLSRRRRGRLLTLISTSGPPVDDRAKRPKIGRAAARLADEVVISTSNPRGEPRARLVGDLVAGARDGGRARVHVEPDRRNAIQRLVELARADDVVMVLGRGAFSTIQERPGDPGWPFDDRQVLRELLGG